MDAQQTYFSPFSLSQTLPFLPLAQSQVDYCTHLRRQSGLFQQLSRQKKVSVMLVQGQRLGLPHGSLERAQQGSGTLSLALLPGEYVPSFVGSASGGSSSLYFLGSASEQHFFALDLDLAQKLSTNSSTTKEVGDFIDRAQTRFEWLDLKSFAPRGLSRDVGLATSAVALSSWQNSQQYCPSCGASTQPFANGWEQVCTQEGPSREFFARIEPAVITEIVDSKDRLLLAHNTAWEPDRYSLCAGFVEAGESFERAVRREAMEELQIPLGHMRYLGSQPWPFPSSLMVAFKAQALTDDVTVDGQEIDHALWVSRDEYSQALSQGTIVPPTQASVAHYMIEQWYGHML